MNSIPFHFFIHATVAGHLGSFHVLVILNNGYDKHDAANVSFRYLFYSLFICGHTSFYCALLYTDNCVCVYFSNYRFVVTLLWANLLALFFQHLLTSYLCHILVILMIFQTFSLLLYLLWWFVIDDLLYYSGLGASQIMPLYDRHNW